MLSWALTFLVIAIIAGLFGFGGIASISVQMAQVIFSCFLCCLLLRRFSVTRGVGAVDRLRWHKPKYKMEKADPSRDRLFPFSPFTEGWKRPRKTYSRRREQF